VAQLLCVLIKKATRFSIYASPLLSILQF